MSILVHDSINTVTFADGACEARSRREEEVDAWSSSTTTNAEIVHNPHLPFGWRRDEPIPLSLLLHYERHGVRRRFADSTRHARHKRHRIYGTVYLRSFGLQAEVSILFEPLTRRTAAWRPPLRRSVSQKSSSCRSSPMTLAKSRPRSFNKGSATGRICFWT